MRLEELINKGEIYLFEGETMLYANDNQIENLMNDKVTEPKEITDFMKTVIQAEDDERNMEMSPEEVLNTINSIHKHYENYTVCIAIGAIESYVDVDEEEDKLLNTYSLYSDLFPNGEKDFVEKSIEELENVEGLLVYNLKTHKVQAVQDGVCCICPPMLFDSTNRAVLIDGLNELASLIEYGESKKE